MAHLAIVITGLTGKLNASFEIVRKLKNEGHTVTYVCPQDISKQIENLGYRFVKVPAVNYGYQIPELNQNGNSWLKKFLYHFKNWGNHYPKGKQLLNLEAYRKIFSELKPDRVLVDMEMHDLIFSVFSLDIPITLFTTWFSDKNSARLPSIRTKVIPGNGLKGSVLGITFTRLYLRAKVRLKMLVNLLTFRHYRRFVLKSYAKEIGFDTSGLTPNSFPPLFSYTKLPIVTMALKELDFPHQHPNNFNYAGPMVFEGRDENSSEIVELHEIEKILVHKEKGQQKLLYCSVGTLVKGDVSFLKNVILAVQNKKDWILILSLGSKLSKSDLGELPANVHVFKYVPQLKVLKYADCSINHGGINSINECIHFKVPMLVYSGGRFDQNGCAARVAFHNLGIMGDKKRDSVEAIRQNINEVLIEERYKENIIRFHGIYKEYQERNISPLIFI